jgi:hypothetical protein
MRMDVRDRNFLQSLAPIEVAAYLRSRGWHEQPGAAHDSALFTLGTDYEVTLPLSSALRDFALRMIDAIRTLEVAEDRDQTEILADLSVSASDVVRVRLADPDARDGSLPLERASEIISSSYDMVLAAACAAVDPKYYFSSRKPPAASNYMRNVRMGQTERGSFVVTILSRVTPDLVRHQAGIRNDVPEPFERKVTERLADALAAIDSSAKAAIATGNIDTFERSVEQGVSANLCDALAGMSEADGTERDVEISVAWARVRPTTHRPFVRYQVGRDIVPVLREVARVFKSRAPQEDFEVRGPVIRLVRVPPDAPGGEVTIAGFVDGVPRNIWVHLEGDDYSRAADAFKQRLLVCVTGVLKKDGRRYWLHVPRGVRLLSPDED